MRILLVKMSSLGDVVHTLAAVTDATREIPGIEFDWVVEESYEAIPHWHSSVRRVIPIALRRWRCSPWEMIRKNEWFRFRAQLRKIPYDLVLDAQGLLKSGWIGSQARGPMAGRNRASAREGLVSILYKRKYAVDLSLPEVEQLRQLFALALNYPAPKSPADFGIDLKRVRDQQTEPACVVFAHGAAWRSKLWPVEHWRALGKEMRARGFCVKLTWGSDEEKLRAESIAQHCAGEVLPRLDISQLAAELAGARLVVGLDTGLTHIAIALGRPTITLYGPSVPVYGAVKEGLVVHLTSSNSKFVDTTRANTVSFESALHAVNSLLSAQTTPA